MNIFIIGGGASGLIAAIKASKNGNKVTILEKNNKCGKKLFVIFGIVILMLMLIKQVIKIY